MNSRLSTLVSTKVVLRIPSPLPARGLPKRDHVHKWSIGFPNAAPLAVLEDTMEGHSGREPIARLGELPRDALLTAAEVGEWLKVAPRQVQRLGIPRIDLGRKTPRYRVASPRT
jgi:hypothetical protein